MVGAGHRGLDWEQGAWGQSSGLCKYGRGCLASCSGPARGCAHPWRLALPSPLASHLFWCESRAAHLHPGPFCPSEWKKENSTTKNPLCQPRIPIESTRQKGGKEQEEPGRSFHKQRFLQIPADPAHLCAGHERLLGRVFLRQHPRPRDCACFSNTKPHISLTDFSGKLLSLGTYSSTKVGDIFLCRLDFT